MKKEIRFEVSAGWKLLLNALGIDTSNVLKRAELPSDLFSLKDASLSTEEYFRMWRAVEFVAGDPKLPLKIVHAMTSDAFSPPIFAAYCSPNLNIALERLSKFKPLIGPMKLEVFKTQESTSLELSFLDQKVNPPNFLAGLELGFFVQLARMATREHLVPLKVVTPTNLENLDDYTEYFGVKPVKGPHVSIQFRADDAKKPFLSENKQMWEFFEPGLRKRLSEVSTQEGTVARVKAVLLEMLPSGQSTVDEVAYRLLMSRRTLQRRLNEEDTNFKNVLAGVREELARHYITRSDLPYTQISFLLGYEDPNSFFRAFNAWTGTTPDSVRTESLH